MVRELIEAIVDNIKWFFNKEKIEQQIKTDTHTIDLQKIEIAKLKKYKERVKELEQEIEKMKELKK